MDVEKEFFTERQEWECVSLTLEPTGHLEPCVQIY